MNWNSEPPTNIDTVLVRLEDGCVKQAWWNSLEWKSQDEGFTPLEGTVTGWLSIDDYIEQTQALARSGAFVGQWEVFEPGVTELEDEKEYLVLCNGNIEIHTYSLYGIGAPRDNVSKKNFYEDSYGGESYGITHYCDLAAVWESIKGLVYHD